MRVTFPCGALQLEGELTLPAACTRGAIICHPHPQYGGDMHDPVVCAVEGALRAVGCATLRFNFRGTGASGGTHGSGVEEIEDVRAATRFLIERSGVQRITLAGYSFGAMVVLSVGADLPEADRLIAIAPPLSFFSLAVIAKCAKPKLFVVGDRDQICSVARLTEQLANVTEPTVMRVLTGADHFFFGHEQALTDAVRAFISE
jgi:alpha/beta superfamily hydrolase